MPACGRHGADSRAGARTSGDRSAGRAGGKAASRTRTELLRLAAWRASRSSLDGVLLSPVTGLPERAAAVAGLLLDHCRHALADAGDADIVTELLAALLARGNGAAFQRAIYRRSGSLSKVIRRAVAVTGNGQPS